MGMARPTSGTLSHDRTLAGAFSQRKQGIPVKPEDLYT